MHLGSKQRTVAALVLATVSTVYPGFLAGALAVQVSAEFDLSEAAYGWALGSFFLAAATASIALGHLVQRVGPRRQIITVLSVTAAAEVGIAAFARSFPAMIAGLVVCGLMNAGNQSAVNLALTRAEISRLGLAIAIKQSGMPAAAMLGGFAVPAIALTAGWRWAYVMGAAMALVALVGVMREVTTSEAVSGPRPRLESPRRVLSLAAVGTGFLSFSAGSLTAWVVASGVDAGLSPGVAGAVMSVGAASGIVLRLYAGWRLDGLRARPFRLAAATVVVGAVGIALLAVRISTLHVAATVLAFGGGWIWPVFTNFGIVRTNPAAAGTATGVTQMGVYIGVFTAPLVTGALIERAGYPTMWVVVAAAALIGATIAMRLADRF